MPKRFGLVLCVPLIGIAFFSGPAASNEFLGSWALYDQPNFLSGISHNHITGINVRVAFGPNTGFCCGPDLFENTALTSADVGHPIVADVANDSDYSAFVAQLTNGKTDDGVTIQWLVLPSRSGGGAPWTEAYWASRPLSTAPADFSGYRLDRIELVPENIAWTSPGRDPNHDGVWTDYFTDARLDFYGTRIPEPTTVSLLMIGGCCLLRWRRLSANFCRHFS